MDKRVKLTRQVKDSSRLLFIFTISLMLLFMVSLIGGKIVGYSIFNSYIGMINISYFTIILLFISVLVLMTETLWERYNRESREGKLYKEGGLMGIDAIKDGFSRVEQHGVEKKGFEEKVNRLEKLLKEEGRRMGGLRLRVRRIPTELGNYSEASLVKGLPLTPFYNKKITFDFQTHGYNFNLNSVEVSSSRYLEKSKDLIYKIKEITGQKEPVELLYKREVKDNIGTKEQKLNQEKSKRD